MTMRLLCSFLYALLLLSLSGLRETALAVVSCQDRITPGGAYRYGDALTLFTEYQGKTYAIAKSAVTGVTSLPDSYFNLSANISREYAMTGVDTASLKALLALGNYGAARPVTIDSAALWIWCLASKSSSSQQKCSLLLCIFRLQFEICDAALFLSTYRPLNVTALA